MWASYEIKRATRPVRTGRQTRERGFSVVEVLLAAVVFAFLTTGLIGAIVYGRQSAVNAGDRTQAVLLANEGIEALRNIGNSNFSGLTDGVHGLAQSGGIWTLTSSPDSTDKFTRQVTITANGTNRKDIAVSVSWPTFNGTAQTTTTVRLTNWTASTGPSGSWTNPVLAGSANTAGSSDGRKIATAGNYAYMVQNAGSNNFVSLDISNPKAPVILSTITLPGTTTNVALNGKYAYVTTTSNSAELVVVDISNPSSPTQVGTYNAAGGADGLGVYIQGNYAYLARAANSNSDELVVLNISNPTTPTRSTGLATNLAMNEVYVDTNNNIFVAVGSTTQELIKYTPTKVGTSYTRTNIDLSGTDNDMTITGKSGVVYVGHGTTLTAVNGTTNAILNNLALPGTINDIDVDTADSYLFAGTTAPNSEFEVVSIANPSSLSIAGSTDLAGTTNSINGVAYDATLDIVVGARGANSDEFAAFTKE